MPNGPERPWQWSPKGQYQMGQRGLGSRPTFWRMGLRNYQIKNVSVVHIQATAHGSRTTNWGLLWPPGFFHSSKVSKKENSNALLVARMVECATCAPARLGPPSMLYFLYVLDHATWVAFANACHGTWAAAWADQVLAQHDHMHWIFGPRESLLRKYGQHVRLFN